MASVPDGLAAAVSDAVSRHLDPEKAIESLLRSVKRSGEWTDFLIAYACSDLVYDARHKMNVSVRRNAGEYGGPAKVNGESGAASNALVKSPHLHYFIAGRCLGDVFGEELGSLADCERQKAETANFHVRLLANLAERVPEGKRVRDCFTERKLANLFNSLRSREPAGLAIAGH